MKALFTVLPAACALALAACSPAPEPAPAPTPVPVETETPEPVADEPVAMPGILEVVAANPDFSTLAAAIEAAGLATTLSSEGPFTVFAPTNAAFNALPAGELDTLLLPENKDRLTRILSYHVVSGKIMSADLPAADAGVATPSVNGLDLSVRVEPDGAVKANQATVTQADIEASNGVIHVIDTVLVPRAEE
jgi:uncharacterized surface protein with fasciclin (FAS1) repeats